MVHQTTVNGESIIVGRNGIALVASHSEPGRWHPVRVGEGVAECDCVGFGFKGFCRHVKAVRALNAQSSEPIAPNPTFALADAMLAGAFDGLPKRRENLHIAEVNAGEEVSFAEWAERKAATR